MAFATTIAGAAFLGVLAHHAYKDNCYVESEAYDYKGTDKESVAVVYYSRAGSSETVARAIAKQLNAPLYPIKTADPNKYGLTMLGLYEATRGNYPDIMEVHDDIKLAKKIVLVSPIWMFRPAPPVWSFVVSGALKDKQVTMVTLGSTGDWQFDNDVEKDTFHQSLKQHGGTVTNRFHFSRGPHAWATPIQETLTQVQAKFAEVTL
jgi:flavodoxin